MSQVPVYLNIRSEYAEADSSRYRFSLTENILIPSLKNQVARGAIIFLQQSPMDPYFKRREKAFRSITDKVIPMHEKESMELPARVEATIGDDDFLGPEFVQKMRIGFTPDRGNVQMFMPHGYIFFEGALHPWRNKDDFIEITQYGNPSSSMVRHEGFRIADTPQWIYCRHQMNFNPLSASEVNAPEIKLAAWKGWHQGIVARYCQTQVLTATANGCELHPLKSKSTIFAKGSARSRRK